MKINGTIFKSPYDLAYNEFVDINGKTYYFHIVPNRRFYIPDK